MQPSRNIIYFNQETASTTIHRIINKKTVFLRKQMAYFRSREMEWSQDDRSLSAHNGVESGIT